LTRRTTYLPPGDFAERTFIGPAISLGPWFCVHPIGKGAIYFGKSANNRFTPEESPLGVLYTGEDLHTAIFEIFGDEFFEDHRVPAWRWMSYGASEMHLPPVSVCDLSDTRTRAALGVDIASAMAPEVEIPQKWALAIMNHVAGADGIQYQSRFTSRKCLALFNRRDIGPKIRTNLMGALSGLAEANRFLDDYQVTVV
jgi:hypothetical protein